jgi:hypothetical protein
MSDEDHGRWVTYAELAALLGSTPSGARMHARRRGWARRTANMIGEVTRVLVPDGAVVPQRAPHSATLTGAQMTGSENGEDLAVRRITRRSVRRSRHSRMRSTPSAPGATAPSSESTSC